MKRKRPKIKDSSLTTENSLRLTSTNLPDGAQWTSLGCDRAPSEGGDRQLTEVDTTSW